MSEAYNNQNEDEDVNINNNSGHIVVDDSENNNVDGSETYNREVDGPHPGGCYL